MDFETWCKQNTDIAKLAKNFKSTSSAPEQYFFFYFSKIFDDVICQAEFEWLPSGSHLDIYVPSLNCAIEYDGSYHHSNRQDNDIDKTLLCQDHEIKVFRILEQGRRRGDKKLSECNDVVIYFPDKEYRNIKTAIDDLILLINENFNLTLSIGVDLDRDKEEILRYVQNKYYQQTIAYIWPEVKDYWCEKEKTIYDVLHSKSKNEYILKCPHCKRTFKLFMRYSHGYKSLPPCNNDDCESKKIQQQLEIAIEDYMENGKIITFDDSLSSRRLYDKIILQIRRHGSTCSKEELELYEKSGIDIKKYQN